MMKTIIKSDKIISENLIKNEVLNDSTAKVNSDKNIGENLTECDVLKKTTEDHINATTKEDTIDENTAKDILKIMTINAILSTSEEEKMPDPTTAPMIPPNSAIRSIKNNLKDIDEMKSFRKKKAFIREGAILPDIIRLGSYIECSRLPAKTFSSRCRDLYKECKQTEECKTHTSFKNLKNLSTKLNMIWSHPEKFPHDWKANKVLLTGKNGYFNLATNYPQLWKEIEKLKESINIFNTTRNNVKEYKTKIRSQLSIEELSEGTIKDIIKIEVSRNDLTKEDSPMVKKLRSKLSYSKTEFEKISIDAFKLDPIKEAMKIWEETNELRTTKEADGVLDNIKLFYPKIIGWSNTKLIRRISENWTNRKNIEELLTDKAIERVKSMELSERENSDTKEFLVKDDHIKNNDENHH